MPQFHLQQQVEQVQSEAATSGTPTVVGFVPKVVLALAETVSLEVKEVFWIEIGFRNLTCSVRRVGRKPTKHHAKRRKQHGTGYASPAGIAGLLPYGVSTCHE